VRTHVSRRLGAGSLRCFGRYAAHAVHVDGYREEVAR
jgi:hypothetical protein